MGKAKKKGGRKKKATKANDDEPEYLGTVEPQTAAEKPVLEEQLEADLQTSTQVEKSVHEPQNEGTTQTEEAAGIDGVEEEPEGEIEMSDQDERPTKRKRHRGPTKMKDLAKDPTLRERVDYNLLGDPYGPGSVKLSSYAGTLVREHVPVIIENWKKVGEDIKTVLWKSVQVKLEES